MPRRDGQLIQGGIDCTFNICSAFSSFYTDDLDEVREIARTRGVRFVAKGGAHSEYIDNPHGISGEMQTRYTNESLDLFHLFRDDEDFAGFVPVNYEDMSAVLELLKERAAERALEAHLAETGQVRA